MDAWFINRILFPSSQRASLGSSCDAPDPISMDFKQFSPQCALRMLHTHHPQLHSLALTHTYPTGFLSTMDISQDRSHQPGTSHGLGAHFTSLVKKRPQKWKTQVLTSTTLSTTFDVTCKRQCLQADLAAILAISYLWYWRRSLGWWIVVDR